LLPPVAALLATHAAEGVTFVSEEDSPNGRPLVIVGNEVSRTVSIFQVDKNRSRY
jgi:hypothetical protein